MAYRLGDSVAWSIPNEDELLVVVMKVPDGEPLVYRETAALIWEVALTTPDVVDAVAQIVGEDPEAIADDVESCLREFTRRGLLKQVIA